MKSSRNLCGTDLLCRSGFLSVRCVIVECSGSLSGSCVPVEIDTVEFCCISSACREISGCVLRGCEHVVVV